MSTFVRYAEKAPLNKWHLVNTIDGAPQVEKYVRFVFCWDLEGRQLDHVPVAQEVYVELEYSTRPK